MSECQRESHASAKAFVSHTAAILGGRYKQPKVKENGHTSLGRPIRHRYGAVNDWETRWQDYVTMTCVLEEIPDVAGRQAVLRSALSHEWTILWSTGRLGITISEDIDTAVEKLRAYIRARRNPLLDRKLFHCRDQEEGESVDQYVTALIRIDRTCAYDNEPHCTRCHRSCGHGVALTETRIRDRLIYGLADEGIQQRVWRRISVSDWIWRELLQSVNPWSLLKKQSCD